MIAWLNFAICALNLLLAAVVLGNNPRRAVNVSGALFLISAAAYNLVNGLYCDRHGSIILLRACFSTGALMACACSAFVYYFSTPKALHWVPSLLAVSGLALGAITQWTPSVILGLGPVGEKAFVAGSYFGIFALYLCAIILSSVAQLAWAYRLSHGLKRLQVQYMLLGFGICALFGTCCSVLLPLADIFLFIDLDSPSTVFLSGSFAYVVLRYRLFDIRRFVARLVATTALALFMMLVHAMLFNHMRSALGETPASLIAMLICVGGMALIFTLLRPTSPFKSLMSFLVGPRLSSLRGPMLDMLCILDKERLVRFIAERIQEHYRPSNVSIYWNSVGIKTGVAQYGLLLGTDQDDNELGVALNNSPDIRLDSAICERLVSAVAAQPTGLVYDEYAAHHQNGHPDALAEFLLKERGKVVMPCMIRGQLQGFIMLGDKPASSAYTHEDLVGIRVFVMQAGIALHNAFLYDDAISDELTGLFNRRYLDARLAERFEAAKRAGCPFAVLMIDADYFKRINDRYGHQSGDTVLQTLADCIRRAVRACDTTARFGGEEFAILLQEFDEQPKGDFAAQVALVASIAERIRSAVECLIVDLQAHRVRVTVSIGACVFSPQYEFSSAKQILQRADEALYAAKRLGRNRVVVWDKRTFLVTTPDGRSMCSAPPIRSSLSQRPSIA